MKKATEHLPNLKTVEPLQVGSSTTSHSATLPDKTVARFFAKMQAIYLNTWSSNFRNEDEVKAAMSIWGESLSTLHIEQIGRGLKVCESRPGFPPTLGEFKRLAVGLPSKNEAVERVIQGNACDPLSVAILRKIGSYDLKTLGIIEITRKATRLYDDLFPVVLEEHSGTAEQWLPELRIVDDAGRQNLPDIDYNLNRSAIQQIKAQRGNTEEPDEEKI